MAIPKIEAVTPQELIFAMSVGSAAATGRIPQSGVGGMGINLEREDGNVERLELTDVPMNRAAIAIRDQFPDGNFMHIMMRVFALGAAMRDDLMKPYVRDADDGSEMIEVHEAVYDIAAVMPLNSKGDFNAKTYFRRVAKRAKEIDEKASDQEA